MNIVHVIFKNKTKEYEYTCSSSLNIRNSLEITQVNTKQCSEDIYFNFKNYFG